MADRSASAKWTRNSKPGLPAVSASSAAAIAVEGQTLLSALVPRALCTWWGRHSCLPYFLHHHASSHRARYSRAAAGFISPARKRWVTRSAHPSSAGATRLRGDRRCASAGSALRRSAPELHEQVPPRIQERDPNHRVQAVGEHLMRVVRTHKPQRSMQQNNDHAQGEHDKEDESITSAAFHGAAA
jgi:hypothetical protein